MLKLTIFTDPMMGLSYESVPFLAKIETHFSGQIEIQTKMAGLVRDVRHFMIAEDFRDGEILALEHYNRRLAHIYQAEQAITGMPIHITPDNLHLFDRLHRSSTPLNLAVKAAELTDKNKEAAFLYRLRYALIVETRPITHWKEIFRGVEQTGINIGTFMKSYQNGMAQAALEQDWALRESLKIYRLPAYLLEYENQHMLLQGVLDDRTFFNAIIKLSEGKILPAAPNATLENLQDFLQNHPLVSFIELKYAFGLSHKKSVQSWIHPLLKNGTLAITGKGEFVAVQR
ncbi:hypothetical protein BKK54_02320 [Rodentibacter genomosp. 1]|uniref:Disulfide bond formation protein DsbA n=1 Tax=Rodentibacter genomosp. 1 TaxID=1908264 RepID=A0A1V3J9C0_9PAST|nr:DsbA family protein [Rodentibacter genomosp. 1]OOF51834.1 hypothetical protein BKK54_02320 [Rodentibacter genomosp. 1]